MCKACTNYYQVSYYELKAFQMIVLLLLDTPRYIQRHPWLLSYWFMAFSKVLRASIFACIVTLPATPDVDMWLLLHPATNRLIVIWLIISYYCLQSSKLLLQNLQYICFHLVCIVIQTWVRHIIQCKQQTDSETILMCLQSSPTA